MRRVLEEEKGQGFLEFILILPIVLMLIFAVLSFGFLVYDRIIIVLAGSQAADCAGNLLNDPVYTSLEERDEKTRDVAKSFLDYGIYTSDDHVRIYYDGSDITVKIETTFTFVLPLLDRIMRGRNVIPLEYQATYKVY